MFRSAGKDKGRGEAENLVSLSRHAFHNVSGMLSEDLRPRGECAWTILMVSIATGPNNSGRIEVVHARLQPDRFCARAMIRDETARARPEDLTILVVIGHGHAHQSGNGD
jgi:hypothetical protein